ncbi:MAG: hypothetical protein EOO41_04380 [Methanobacteriota archaeon]|nr:MAG: hypothetical protein EOO41_04380 [Euryarchaeota archaeon]
MRQRPPRAQASQPEGGAGQGEQQLDGGALLKWVEQRDAPADSAKAERARPVHVLLAFMELQHVLVPALEYGVWCSCHSDAMEAHAVTQSLTTHTAALRLHQLAGQLGRSMEVFVLKRNTAVKHSLRLGVNKIDACVEAMRAQVSANLSVYDYECALHGSGTSASKNALDAHEAVTMLCASHNELLRIAPYLRGVEDVRRDVMAAEEECRGCFAAQESVNVGHFMHRMEEACATCRTALNEFDPFLRRLHNSVLLMKAELLVLRNQWQEVQSYAQRMMAALNTLARAPAPSRMLLSSVSGAVQAPVAAAAPRDAVVADEDDVLGSAALVMRGNSDALAALPATGAMNADTALMLCAFQDFAHQNAISTAQVRCVV